ncbi:MAG: ABC transporter ATP-binding protein [Ilumatobacteraceae bacterium]
MALLEVTNLNVRFPTEDGVVHAVRDVSFSLEPGEVLGVVGESGSGKSVTNMAIMGLLPKSTRIDGSILYKGDELVGRTQRATTKFRGREIGMIFQDPMTSLNPVYTVGWQISEAVRAHNDINKKQAHARAVELLDLVGIPHAATRADSYPHEFSGGMRQRAMIAMAMANNPEVLIADEPTTALDVTVQAQILETLIEIKDRTKIAIILITHDLGVVAGMADRVMVMYAGAAVEIAPVDEIYYQPRMPYTIGLLGAIPSDASDGQKLRQIKGTTPSLIDMKPGCPFSTRCPLVIDRCRTETPALENVGTPGHVAACHRKDEVPNLDVRAQFAPEVTL